MIYQNIILTIQASFLTALVGMNSVQAQDQYPAGELGRAVQLGETLVRETNTHPLSSPYVGNALQCTSCHLEAGRHPKAASLISVASAYPAYSPRERKVITLEDRILNCFIRSQNGKRPPNGGKVSVAIAAYITWLSTDFQIKMNADAPLGPNKLQLLNGQRVEPSRERGKPLYANRCSSCHAHDGSGSEGGPPIWGGQSFNDGAGLAKVPKMAAWLKVAMPPDETDLTDEEAFDVAAFINSHDRPRFRSPATPKQSDR